MNSETASNSSAMTSSSSIAVDDKPTTTAPIPTAPLSPKLPRSSNSKTGSGSLGGVSPGRIVGGGNSPLSPATSSTTDPSSLSLPSSVTTQLPLKPKTSTGHHRKGSAGSVISWSETNSGSYPDSGPARFPTAPNNAEIYDSLEREQEAIVNKLQREISVLKGETTRSRSQSTSSSTSVSRRPSTRSIYSSSDTEEIHPSGSLLIPPSPLVSQRSTRTSFGSGSVPGSDEALVNSLRRENESLKRRLADLSIKVAEKDKEIESLLKSKKGSSKS